MKPHPDFPDYLVTEDGQIISTKYRKPRPMKQGLLNSGYHSVVLRKDNAYHNKLVHRLVAETYLPNVEGKREVNHIDGNKLNNNVNNLEWVTPRENTAQALAKTWILENVATKEIIQITNLKQWCDERGLFHSGLIHTLSGKQKTHGGWRVLHRV